MTSENVEGSLITKVSIENILPIREKLDVYFDPRVNVLIGPNSTGKTTILKLLKSAGPDGLFDYLMHPADTVTREVYLGSEKKEQITEVPLIWIPATRAPLLDRFYSRPSIYHRGDTEQSPKTPDDDSYDQSTMLSSIDCARLINSQYIDRDPQKISKALEVAKTAMACTSSICHEVIAAQIPRDYIDNDYVQNAYEDQRIRVPEVLHLMSIETVDDPDRLVYAGELSSGTQGLYLWTLYLSLRMAYFHGWFGDNPNENWRDQPGVLLMDEIENHLHPQWQRRVIPALREQFKNLQIFATTHSPFVVAGLKEGQVHKLYRDKGKIVRVETNEYDIIAWTADEILAEFMGVTDPTDQDTARAVEIVRWLERSGPLDEDDSAEEWRLSEVERLESLVGSKEAVSEEIVVLNWLKGGVSNASSHVELPLQGRAEQWRLSVVEEFRKDIGIELMSGGPIGWRRGILEQIMTQQSDEFLGEDPSDDLESDEADTEE